jgi:hypothetical protein
LHRAINVICRSSIIYPVRNNAPLGFESQRLEFLTGFAWSESKIFNPKKCRGASLCLPTGPGPDRGRGRQAFPPLSEPEALPPGQKPLWGGA